VIAAPPQQIAEHIIDFRRWVDWSPWEGLDPDLWRKYQGPPTGVGAAYQWSGNRRAGQGRMEITGVAEDGVDIELAFTKPFRSVYQDRFAFTPQGPAVTGVTWSMRAPKGRWSWLTGRLFNLERFVGPDLERGLISLKQVVETA
jgi:hypothetical protein